MYKCPERGLVIVDSDDTDKEKQKKKKNVQAPGVDPGSFTALEAG
jgi:hypothetical protein